MGPWYDHAALDRWRRSEPSLGPGGQLRLRPFSGAGLLREALQWLERLSAVLRHRPE